MNDIPIAILAGKNKGKHKTQEEQDKSKTGECYKTKFLDGDRKLFINLKNGKRVLESTIHSASEATSRNPVVIGNSDELEFILKGYNIIIENQTGESLGDNVVQLARYVRDNMNSNSFLLLSGDLPSITPEDIQIFLDNAYSEDKDVVMGLTSVDEMDQFYRQIRSSQTERPKKFGIRFKDNKGVYQVKNPKLTFGSVFLLKELDKAETFREKINQMFEKKRLFKNPDNYPEIADLLKDDEVDVEKYPSSRLALATFALRHSTPMRRLLLGNYLTRARSDYSMSLTDTEELLENKVFNNEVSIGITRAPARFGYDIDDENDIDIANSIYAHSAIAKYRHRE